MQEPQSWKRNTPCNRLLFGKPNYLTSVFVAVKVKLGDHQPDRQERPLRDHREEEEEEFGCASPAELNISLPSGLDFGTPFSLCVARIWDHFRFLFEGFTFRKNLKPGEDLTRITSLTLSHGRHADEPSELTQR